MTGRRIPVAFLLPLMLLLVSVSGCLSPGERATLLQERQVLRETVTRLERTVLQRETTIARLHQQIDTLKDFSPQRPSDLFAPVKVEIASLTGGADYDGQPGDDGITVHLRLRDRDGDAVKVPGQIRVQLLDNSDLAKPTVIGVHTFNDPEALRTMWFGKFGTQHYTLKCPFQPGTPLPKTQQLTVAVEFVDFLTGARLTATREVSFSLGRLKIED
ncbi:MAG: hypothetical protein IID05_13315 [Gemmatimonadetes bacterium]|nr:hypothetical protein [Gemmatimonadota bacterium]